jgi:hypothetical protein
MGRWQRDLVQASLFGLVPAILVGALVLYVTWADNLGTAIRNEDGVDWLYWLMLGGAWALPAFVLITAVAAVVLRFARSRRAVERERD